MILEKWICIYLNLLIETFCKKKKKINNLFSCFLYFPQVSSCKFSCGKHRDGGQGFVFLTLARKSQHSEVTLSWVWTLFLLFLSSNLLSPLILSTLICQMGITVIPSFRSVVGMRYDFLIMANTGSCMASLPLPLSSYIAVSTGQAEGLLPVVNHAQSVPWWKASHLTHDLCSLHNGL